MSNDAARAFLQSIAGFTDQADEGGTLSQDKPVKIGTVDVAYNGAGLPKVLFDGESLMGVKGYPWINRRPFAGDRVVLLPQGRSYVITGTLGVMPGANVVPGDNLPTGTSLSFHGTTAPSGFLLEDGGLYVQSNYPELYAVLGTRHNIGGELSNQFRVPDSRGRVAVGKAAGGTFLNLASKNGAETVALGVGEMPIHNHTQLPHNHTQQGHGHSYSTNQGTAVFNTAGGTGMDNRGNNNVVTTQTVAVNIESVGVNQAAGGGNAHNNIQPSLTVLKIIKT